MKTINSMFFLDKQQMVYSLATKLANRQKKPIILCVGTDKVIADCLGPLVGHLLIGKYNINTHVYGSLQNTVNATNLSYYLEHIKKTHPGRELLVVDASLGLFEQVGNITLHEGGIVASCLSNTKKIGDLGITATVLEKGFRNKLLLAPTKLSFIQKMAQDIASIIYNAYSIIY